MKRKMFALIKEDAGSINKTQLFKIVTISIIIVSVITNIYLVNILTKHDSGFYIRGTYAANEDTPQEVEYLSFLTTSTESEGNEFYYSLGGNPSTEGVYTRLSNNIYRLDIENETMGFVILENDKLSLVDQDGSSVLKFDKTEDVPIVIGEDSAE